MSNLQPSFNPQSLGEMIRAKRKQLGLRIDDAAALCGVAKDTLMKVEHGNPKVQLMSVLLICHGLGITLEANSGESEDVQDVWV